MTGPTNTPNHKARTIDVWASKLEAKGHRPNADEITAHIRRLYPTLTEQWDEIFERQIRLASKRRIRRLI